MNLGVFVERVRKAAPGLQTLRDHGLSDEEAADIRATFACPARETPLPCIERNSPAQRLLAEFDTSNLEIGAVRFLGAPIEDPRGVQFAVWEASPIIETKDGVFAFDHALPNVVEARCAASSGAFLLALGDLACWNKVEWQGNYDDFAALLAKRAEEPLSQSFFRSLMPTDD